MSGILFVCILCSFAFDCCSAFIPKPALSPQVWLTSFPHRRSNPKTRLRAEIKTEIESVKNALTTLIEEKNCGPILIRLSWHDAGTYNAKDRSGGARGVMRFEDGESKFAANFGLDIARDILEEIKKEVAPDMSYSDFWALAGVVAVKAMGGPDIKFRVGRIDAQTAGDAVEEGRHPDGDKGADHLREVFYRMGLQDKEIVALSGAHTVGKCHVDRSGFDGPWTEDPFKFDNSYFVDMLNKQWIETTTSAGNPQFKDGEDGEHMMLISDLALMEDEKFRPFVELYANDQNAFFADYAAAFQKLSELGCEKLKDP